MNKAELLATLVSTAGNYAKVVIATETGIPTKVPAELEKHGTFNIQVVQTQPFPGAGYGEGVTEWTAPFAKAVAGLRMQGQADVVLFCQDPMDYANDFKTARSGLILKPGTLLIVDKVQSHINMCTGLITYLQEKKVKFGILPYLDDEGKGILIATL